MSDFEDLSTRMPDMASVLAQRIAARNASTNPATPKSGFDPYQTMVNKKSSETTEVDPATIQRWPEESVKQLEDYCKKVGIVGFNAGRMHPIAALAMLKKQFGDFSDTPLEERVPEGFEKRGTPSGYGPNYPYSQAMQKKQIIHG